MSALSKLDKPDLLLWRTLNRGNLRAYPTSSPPCIPRVLANSGFKVYVTMLLGSVMTYILYMILISN